jgi:IclR family transcriptional regulator, KDG regulon repressor
MVNKNTRLESGDRLLTILECFTLEKPEWGVSELSDHLQIYKSVVHRALTTLKSRGYIVQNNQTQKYSLGIKLFELGMIVANQMDIRIISKPIMDELVKSTEETIMLTIVEGFEGMCIEKVESPKSIRSTSPLGKKVPLHAGAATKILMANLPPESIETIIAKGLERYSENTVCDPDELLEQLKTIKAAGYCISYGEYDYGSIAVAASITNYEGTVVGSLSITGPEFRMQNNIELLLSQCISAARTISQALGAK